MGQAGPGNTLFDFYALECIVFIPQYLEDPIHQLQNSQKNVFFPNREKNF